MVNGTVQKVGANHVVTIHGSSERKTIYFINSTTGQPVNESGARIKSGDIMTIRSILDYHKYRGLSTRVQNWWENR